MIKSFKEIIAPIQHLLISNNQCVGCGAFLKLAKRKEIKEMLEKVVCKCGRIYVFDITTKKYRRALQKEI